MPQQFINLPVGGVTPPTDPTRGDSLRVFMTKSQDNFSELYSFGLEEITERGATSSFPISLTNSSNATNPASGALRVTGGVGIGLNLNVGGGFILGGPATLASTATILSSASIGGNLSVAGNLVVSGTQTVVNSTVVTLTDPVFHVGGSAPPAVDDNFDRGIAFHWHNGTTGKTGFFGQKDNGRFAYIPDATEVTPNVFAGSLGTIEAAAFLGAVTGDVSGFALSETLASVTSRGATTTASIGVGSRISVRGDGANLFWLRAANGSEPAACAIGIGLNPAATEVSRVVLAAGGLNVAEVVSDSLRPGADDAYDLGTVSRRWRNIYADTLVGATTTAVYADLAERYEADAPYPPGTVVIFGGEKEITTQGQRPYDWRVAGVVSTQPGMMLNSDAGTDDTHPYVALTGRVPCHVVGMVRKGDLIVASDIPGLGMAADLDALPSLAGRIIGRAIQAKSDPSPAFLEIAVQRG